jgi:hypothetical protein
MTNKKMGAALLAFLVCGMVQAAPYSSPDVRVGDPSPAYRPTKGVSYEDSYHIAGVAWTNDRAIASEAEEVRKPSSVEPEKEVQHEPKPWLHKEMDDKEKY